MNGNDSFHCLQFHDNQVFNQQVENQFGTQRYALLFKPGSYNVDANVGFFTQVAGLGLVLVIVIILVLLGRI